MKGKMILVIRKWWVLILVLALALSLTSCSKKRQLLNNNNGSFGFSYVDGNLGQFDCYTIPRANGFDVDLVLIPFQATNGDIVTIGIVNSQSLVNRVVVPQVAIQVDAEIATIISVSDLANYDVVAIRPFTQGGFLDGNVAADAIGPLPLPPGFGQGAF